jgi:hypothetical protein
MSGFEAMVLEALRMRDFRTVDPSGNELSFGEAAGA